MKHPKTKGEHVSTASADLVAKQVAQLEELFPDFVSPVWLCPLIKSPGILHDHFPISLLLV